MRVLLIQPPVDLFDDDEKQPMPPLGLAYIAAVLERAGHEVSILDCVVAAFARLHRLPDGRLRHGLDTEGIVKEISRLRPHLAGVSNLFSAQSQAAHEVCRLVKETDPAIVTVMGGAHPSGVPEEVLADLRVDYVVQGEAESAMLRLATLDRLIRKPLDLRKVPPLVRAARKLGMGVSTFFVVGFPGETRADIEKTFNYAMNLGADHVHFFTATQYPGADLFRQCVEMGLMKTPVDYTQLRVGRPMFDTAEWTADELVEITREAQARFYRQTAVRRPVRFAVTVARKFVREPRLTARKAWRTLFAGETAADTREPEPISEPLRPLR